LDPFGVYLGNGRQILGEGKKGNFNAFAKILEDSFERISNLIKE